MSFLDRFRRKKKEEPKRKSQETLGGGHRGIARGDAAAPDFSAENVAKWKGLTGNEVENFVYHGEVFECHSTNVRLAIYDIAYKELIVQYHNGASWKYGNVSEDEAIGFAKAQSKGTYINQLVKVPGSNTRHRKPATRLV